MIPKFIFILPFLFQGCVMILDEFYFHKKRGLPTWEQIGHPLDTLSVLACFTCASYFPPTAPLLLVFIGLSAFSCLFVTKDEFIHHLYCSAEEQWLHSLLFILHPICLLSAGWMWWLGGFETFLRCQTFIFLAFMAYQLIYWNILWKPNKAPYNSTQSITTSMIN